MKVTGKPDIFAAIFAILRVIVVSLCPSQHVVDVRIVSSDFFCSLSAPNMVPGANRSDIESMSDWHSLDDNRSLNSSIRGEDEGEGGRFRGLFPNWRAFHTSSILTLEACRRRKGVEIRVFVEELKTR